MSGPTGTVCVLASGGVESAYLLHHASERSKKVIPVYVRCGFSWEKVERAHLSRFLRALRSPRIAPVVTLDFPMADVYGSHWSVTGKGVPGPKSADAEVYLPGRNLTLIAKAAVLAAKKGASAVEIGTLATNPFPDGNARFFAKMADAASTALGRPLAVRAPLSGLRKPEVIRRGRALPLDRTFSCIRPRAGRHCGACNKCAERKQAFFAAGVPDRTRYAQKGIA